MSEVTITLNQIRQHRPCEDSWKKALRALGKTEADDTEITFGWIIEACGLDDALWALRCLPAEEQWRSHLFARLCALHVNHRWNAPTVRIGSEGLRHAAWDDARTIQAAKLIEIMSLECSPEALVLPMPEGGAQ